MLRTAVTPLIALALASPTLTEAAVEGGDAHVVSAVSAAASDARGAADLARGLAPGLEAAASGAGLSNLPGLGSLAGLRGADLFPPVIPLPDGFAPEGVAVGYGPLLYAGSRQDGAIWRGDAITGRGAVLVPGAPGRSALGLEVDRRGRLWVAGGTTGTARVYDSLTGAELASYQLVPDGQGFVNDVVVTRTAAYLTDSRSGTLQVVPIGPGGKLADQAVPLALSGDLQVVDGLNLNGIETTPDGKALLAVQTATGLLFRIDPTTGVTTRVAGLGDGALSDGDGLLRQGTTLYVVRNRSNQIAVLDLDPAGTSATIARTLTDDDFDVPTTIGLLGPFLYAVNARFSTEVTPTTRYDIVRVTRN